METRGVLFRCVLQLDKSNAMHWAIGSAHNKPFEQGLGGRGVGCLVMCERADDVRTGGSILDGLTRGGN